VGGVDSQFSPEGTYTEFFRTRTPNTETSAVLPGSFGPEVGLDVAVRPVPYLRLGATWTRTREEAPDRAGEEVATVRPGALRAYAELVVPTPRAGGFGLDLSLGGGLERNTSAVQGETFQAEPAVGAAVERAATNGFLQATLDVVTPRRVSFFVRLTTRSLPPVAVPEMAAESAQFPGVVVYRLDAHEVDFGGYREVSWGTRFRF
jgi:hypothetical protein